MEKKINISKKNSLKKLIAKKRKMEAEGGKKNKNKLEKPIYRRE